jgi:hypothetical protein
MRVRRGSARDVDVKCPHHEHDVTDGFGGGLRAFPSIPSFASSSPSSAHPPLNSHTIFTNHASDTTHRGPGTGDASVAM